MRCISVFVLIAVVVGTIVCETPKIPSFVKTCKRNVDIDKCIAESMTGLIPYMAKGIPAMKIPRMEPLFVPKAQYHSDSLDLEFYDVSLYNIGRFDMNNVHVDFDKRTLEINYTHTIPVILDGHYSVKGNFGMFAIGGEGHLYVNMSNIKAYAAAQWVIIQRDGKEYADIQSLDYKLDIGSYKSEFENVVAGNPQLTAVVNDAFNESGKDVVEDVAEKVFQGILFSIIKQVFSSHPLDVLLPIE